MKKQKSFILKGFLLFALAGLFGNTLLSQIIITQWTFEGNVLTPSTGVGVANNVGGTSTAYATGVPGIAWNTSQYPAQGTNSGTAGVQFTVSTTGYESIVLSWDQRHSNTAANRVRVQYTLNGTQWLNFEANNSNAVNTRAGTDVGFDNGRFIADAGDAWYVRSANFSGIAGVNNNAMFAIRIVSEFVDGTNYGASTPTSNYATTGTWRFDNVTFSGVEIAGSTPVKLAVVNVNNGNSPSVNTPFSVVVQAQDANNLPSNVTSATTVQLSKATGTGVLSGTLTGTIQAGSNSVTFDAVTYNVAESGVSILATRTSGMVLAPGTSAPFTVLPAANHLAFVNFPTYGQVNQPLAAFTVEARRNDNTVDLNYTGQITISKATGPGNISGTLTKQAVAGVATFNDIQIDATGSYTLLATASGLTDGISPVVMILGQPQMSSVIVPQFMQGLNGSNTTRIPVAYRLAFSGLIPNATYRYINQIALSSDLPTYNGAGNVIFVTQTGDFFRTTSTSLSTPGQYNEFTTDATGSYTGWFITEPTGNDRFTPGNYLFIRVRLNNGAGGTTAQHYLTSPDSIKVINFGTTSDPNQGTGVYGKYFSTSKNFAFLYDNESGSGRPITGTFIENDGTTGGTSYPAFYQNLVDGQEGSWGAIIPNQLPNGIRNVVIRDRLTGNVITGGAVSANGAWPYGNNTVNPTGGTSALLITPWPDFTANQTNIAPGTQVSFAGFALGNPISWSWVFVGGTPGTSTLQNPQITYFSPGEFDVSMTVTTEFGSQTILKANYINVNTLPWPDFTGTPTVVATGGSVTFTDQSTGNPTQWVWTFQGGSPATFNGQTPPAIVYNNPGQFDVTLTVTNTWGSNSITKTAYITVGYAPVANFSGSPTNIIQGQSVQFTDLSQHNPTSWQWTFEGGNPSSSTQQNPQVSYPNVGSFSVTLVVTNQFGSSTMTKNNYIIVQPVGVSQLKATNLEIWPNPTSGLLQVKLPYSGMTLHIYDVNGRKVATRMAEDRLVQVDLSQHAKGIYFLEAIESSLGKNFRNKFMIY